MEEAGHVAIANRIFEMVLLNMFIVEDAPLTSTAFQCGERDRNQFITGGKLNMNLVFEKFVEYFHDIYDGDDEYFLEKNRRRFSCFT